MTNRVYQEARKFGAPVRMTRADHLSGTDRVAEVASAEAAEIIVNVQGDEPLIDPAAIDAAVLPLLDDAPSRWATLKKRIENPREIDDPNVVKVVTDLRGQCAIFLALARFRTCASWAARGRRLTSNTSGCMFIAGIFYSDIRICPSGPLEQAERLEQLRALENGHPIRVVETEYESIGVDTPDDLERM